jgi:hypothetical protein
LSTTALVSLGSGGIGSFTDTQVAGLTLTQIDALVANNLVSSIATDAIDSLVFGRMSTANTSALFAGLTDPQLGRLTTGQGESVVVDQLDGIQNSDLQALSAAFISGLRIAVLQGFANTQIVQLTGEQIGAFTDATINGMATANKTALEGRTPQPVIFGDSSSNGGLSGADGRDDIILAGAGNDTITNTTGNDRIHGGAGFDTLSATATAVQVNLVNYASTSNSFKSSIERVDLSVGGTLACVLNLDGAWLANQGTVNQIHDASTLGGASSGAWSASTLYSATRKQLVVEGDSNDTLNLSSAWGSSLGVVTKDGNNYDVYNHSNGQAQVFVRSGVSVSTSLSGTVDGVTVAGPMLSSLDVLVYDGSGALLTSTSTDAQGHFSLEGLNNYSGLMLLVLRDKNGAAADYNDEFTGTQADLSTDLRALINYTGAGTDLSITPLSELVVRLLGVQAGQALPVAADSAAKVAAATTQVAQAFGLTDLLGDVVAVNDTAHATAGADAKTFGKMLGALSMLDSMFGDMDVALNAVVNHLTVTQSNGEVSDVTLSNTLSAWLTAGTAAMDVYTSTSGTAADKLAAAKASVEGAGLGFDLGTSAADSLTGSNNAFDVLIGAAGNDTFTHTTGFGPLSDIAFGGAGMDTYQLAGSGQSVSSANLFGIEKIDLTGTGDNTLSLTLASVLNNGAKGLFTNGNNGWNFGAIETAGKMQLLVDGNTGDQVTNLAGWTYAASTVSINTHTYDVYEATVSGVTAQLLVDHNINRVL